jgi:hypothetical protein
MALGFYTSNEWRIENRAFDRGGVLSHGLTRKEPFLFFRKLSLTVRWGLATFEPPRNFLTTIEDESNSNKT